jgi:drug/metabolite transporter (DMT)-like permease
MKVQTLPIMLMIGAIFCIASMEAISKYLMEEIGPIQTIWGLILLNKFPDFWTIVGALVIILAGIYACALGQVK